MKLGFSAAAILTQVFFCSSCLEKGLKFCFSAAALKKAGLEKGCLVKGFLAKGMGGRGGHRHFPKPYVDPGLLFKVLQNNQTLVEDLGGYERISKAQAPDPRALLANYDLCKGLISCEKSCQVHPQPLRAALLKMLQEKPDMNQANFSGEVWINLKIERLTTMMAHLRKLARDDNFNTCAAKLKATEFMQMKKLLQSIVIPENALEKAMPLQKGTDPTPAKTEALEKAASTVGKAVASLKKESPKLRKLKREDSEVTLDSDGLPAMFRSPGKKKKAEKAAKAASVAASPTICRKRKAGSRLASPSSKGSPSTLKKAMGFAGHLKRPAAAALKKAKATTVAKDTGVRKPWLKLHKVKAAKPERSYILGSTDGGKAKLVVEVSRSMSEKYDSIIDALLLALKKESLTKQEALERRAELCSKW